MHVNIFLIFQFGSQHVDIVVVISFGFELNLHMAVHVKVANNVSQVILFTLVTSFSSVESHLFHLVYQTDILVLVIEVNLDSLWIDAELLQLGPDLGLTPVKHLRVFLVSWIRIIRLRVLPTESHVEET